jgi:hypothetical protein
MNNEIQLVLTNTINKLDRRPNSDNGGKYYSMQYEFDKNARVYICLSSFVDNQYIVHEEFDLHGNLNNTKVMMKDDLLKYVSGFKKITFIGMEMENEKMRTLLHVKY